MSHYKRGLLAEHIAHWWLWCKGYRLLKHRYRVPVGEIDLIMKKGNTIIFVEVKYRSTLTDALHALTSHQQQRLVRSAQLYMTTPRFASHNMRFDVVCLAPWRWPLHVQQVM